MSEDPFETLEELLSAILGPQTARDAVAALRSSGIAPEQLASMGGMEELARMSPGQAMAMRAQLSQMFAASSSQPVNWTMGRDLALQQAREGAGDPTVTAAQAQAIRRALTVADLWLDTATELMPAPGGREAWSREAWVTQTMPVWKDVCAPVAQAATRALFEALTHQMRDMGEAVDEAAKQVGALEAIMRTMAGAAFGMQLGHAIGRLAQEAVASTEVGLPLTREPGTALLPANISAFAAELEEDEEEVRMFFAVREAATARLYAHVPWLRGQVMSAVEAYARGIAIDTDAVEAAVAQVDLHDPEAIQAALAGGMFSPQSSPEQLEALGRLETLLALIEGWVQVVTERAIAPHLPRGMALAEMMRRRRAAGGPAEQVFAQLIGLEFRPRLAREAAELWRRIGSQAGDAERDAFWQHPDVMPTASELAHPEDFLTMRQADKDMDADLASLLDGTLGYTDAAREADRADQGGRGKRDESPDSDGPGAPGGED
ncbi:zinc-dependent metalloprotease [Actinomyces gaoshouyii]|uniref:Hydrolase n=1 Tax=Actinomyces gaoshouyii TaxID=1960083 RepID=A0A8H9HCS5_9ACTO|nr:zinc-dependent metalloprotease [Actinomyces gaoshouyii]GGO97023.1 hydrolase [Actinomyces gaoshouyii]